MNLDLCRATEPEVALALDRADMVFVLGGYPIFLLEWAQRSGFLREACQRVGDGKLLYAGVSAGAALAGPSMEPLAASDDPGRVIDFPALALIDHVVISHVNRYPATVFDERRREWHGRLDLVPLSDDENLTISGTNTQRISSA